MLVSYVIKALLTIISLTPVNLLLMLKHHAGTTFVLYLSFTDNSLFTIVEKYALQHLLDLIRHYTQ